MNKLGAGVACLVAIVILGGFAYAYIAKLTMFNQTKSKLESLGFDISNNVTGVDVSTFLQSTTTIVSIVDVDSFISIARQYNSTTIYERGSSFYVITLWIVLVTAYEYTPSHSIWWIWG